MTTEGSRHIIVVEDDEFIAAALVDLLQTEGFVVRVAQTLKQATLIVEGRATRTVVLLDPLVRGVTSAALLEVLNEGSALITIALAAYPSERLIAPDVLLEMVHEAFAGNGRGRARSRRAA